MTKAGKSLEELVSRLERALGSNGPVEIKSPAMLKDRITGDQREFDVLVTIKSSHHTLVTAIECRDWDRPLDVSHIETYETKCRDCGVHAKAIVSSNGFTATALEKGRFYGIRCLTLNDIDTLSWLKTPEIEIRWRTLVEDSWHLDVVDPNRILAGVPPADVELCFRNGGAFDQEYLKSRLKAALGKHPVPDVEPGSGWCERFEFGDHNICLRRKSTNEYFEIDVTAALTFRMDSRKESFRLFQYNETDTNRIARGAVASLAAPGSDPSASVVLIEQSDGSRRLVVFDAPQLQCTTLLVEDEALSTDH